VNFASPLLVGDVFAENTLASLAISQSVIHDNLAIYEKRLTV